MSTYSAPLKDMQFVLRELAGLDRVAELPGFGDATADLVEAILEEAGKFAGGALAPLNFSGRTTLMVWPVPIVYWAVLRPGTKAAVSWVQTCIPDACQACIIALSVRSPFSI